MVFSNLNLAPNLTDEAFGVTMKNLFRYFGIFWFFGITLLFNRKHLECVLFKEGGVVFFGQNFRGLIAAREMTEVNN